MNFFRHSLSSYTRRRHVHQRHQIRTLYDAVSTLKCPRDRGLDHAVERERHLKPVLNLKNLIISEPSKSIPLALITQSKETLRLPFRPIEFIRKYPSIFQEFHPGSLNIQPHIKLTPEIISLSSEENFLYQSVNYKQEIARRLLKLLMIGRNNKIPIFLLERLKWELGLPQDYEKDIIPEFPDYFRVIDDYNFGENGKILELVCWTDEFAVSEMQNKGARDGKTQNKGAKDGKTQNKGAKTGKPQDEGARGGKPQNEGAKNGNTQFLLQYSKGFEMDKKYKKWVDEWQKLPYISPYENAMHLAAKTDESDKWAVSVLHELLNLFVGKKAERDSLLYLGEYLGLRSRFKLAFLQHPGIFYVSSKIGTHTVVLKEGYKRGMLIERDPMMNMRFKYVQLMNVVEDEEKSKSTEKTSDDNDKGSEGKESEDGEEDNSEMYDSSSEDENDESDDYDEGIEGENVSVRGRLERNGDDFEEKNSRRNMARRTNARTDDNDNYKEGVEGENISKRGRIKRKGADFEDRKSRRNATRTNGRTDEKDNYNEEFEGENVSKRGRFRRKDDDFVEENSRRNVARRTNGRKDENGNYNERFGGDNMNRRTRFERKDDDFEEKNSRRNMARRTNGRKDENDNYNKGFGGENMNRRRRFERKGDDFEEKNSRRNVSRTNGRTDKNYKEGFEGENVNRRGRFKRKGDDFEEKNYRRSVTRTTSGRSNEENVHRSSTSFSRRKNVGGGDLVIPRLRTRKIDFPGNKVGAKTGETRM